jgi:hypothetical protein
MTTGYKYLAIVLVLIALSALDFVAGVKVESWHRASVDAAAKKQEDTDVTAAAKTLADMGQRITDHVDALNKSNDEHMTGVFAKLTEQDHAFAGINYQLARVQAGSCTFTPAADSLLSGAYEASFGASPAGSAAPAKPAAARPKAKARQAH